MKKLNYRLGIAVLFGSVFYNCSNNSGLLSEDQETNKVKAIISEPIRNCNIEYAKYMVDPEKDTVIISNSGSKLIIPQNAFVDSSGQLINTGVTIEYREFSNALEVYLGGVPMVYQDNGEEKVFETAGMLELNAYSKGNPVFPNPENRIKVEMTSFTADSQYNLYKLDTNSGKWTKIGKDSISILKMIDDTEALPDVPRPPAKGK